MSSSFSADSTLTRYRPVILTLAGASAAYAIYLIHKNYIAAHEASVPHARLQRHGAVRNPQHTRVRGRSSSVPEARVRIENAIEQLQRRETEGRSYALVEIYTDATPRPIPIDLLFSRLPSIAQLEEQYAVSPNDARNLRRRSEDLFLDAFLQDTFVDRTISQLEEQYLRIGLLERGVNYEVTSAAISRFNNEQRPVSRAGPERNSGSGAEHDQDEWLPADQLLGPEDREETIVDDESDDEMRTRDARENHRNRGQAQGLQNLVYNIAKDQAVREGYIHRGVSCNSCGMLPIRGVRYRCANCNDYDLCEDCEAAQVHIKTHLFFKVRIPAPFLGNGRPALPVWYPGKPNQMTRTVPRALAERLKKENDLEYQDIDALWDQFTCLAATEWTDDPNKLGMAVDRKTFDKCFVPATSVRPPPPNLLYDRMFALYDTDNDGYIGFEEFVSGVAVLMNTSRDERLKRIFRGYDLDNDGFVSRKDFLRVFRAWFVVQKELTRDAIAGIEDEFFTDGGIRDIVLSSQPISSAFPGPIPDGIPSRSGMGKAVNNEGDMAIVDGQGPLREDTEPRGDRFEAIADAGRPRPHGNDLDAHLTSGLRTWSRVNPLDSGTSTPDIEWPPDEDELLSSDVAHALGQAVSIEEIMDPVDRVRVIHAMEDRQDHKRKAEIENDRQAIIHSRWKRRQFYTDEEEGSSAPPGYHEAWASSDEEDEAEFGNQATSVSNSRPRSPRSRSSSKVRFEDSVTDTEYETRSNTSSRSIPVGERWGGFELAEPEKDVGKDFLYLSVQQGFNEMLDDLFKAKEDLAMDARTTAHERQIWHQEILDYEARKTALEKREQTAKSKTSKEINPHDRPLTELLEQSGYSIVDEADNQPQESDLSPPNAMISGQDLNNSLEVNTNIRYPHNDPSSPSHTRAHEYGESVPRNRTNNVSPLQHVENAGSFQEMSRPGDYDPTLPQFRPNTPTSPTRTDRPLLSTQPSTTGPQSRPTDSQLQTWSRHRQHDLEMSLRGGKEGTLSYDEFVRKMIGDRGVSPFGDSDRKGTITGKDIEDLINTGELGRLAFVGSWIEMASF